MQERVRGVATQGCRGLVTIIACCMLKRAHSRRPAAFALAGTNVSLLIYRRPPRRPFCDSAIYKGSGGKWASFSGFVTM